MDGVESGAERCSSVRESSLGVGEGGDGESLRNAAQGGVS